MSINVTSWSGNFQISDEELEKYRNQIIIRNQNQRSSNTYIITKDELLDFFTDSKYGYQYCSYFIKKLDNGKLEIVRGYFTEDGLEAEYLDN